VASSYVVVSGWEGDVGRFEGSPGIGTRTAAATSKKERQNSISRLSIFQKSELRGALTFAASRVGSPAIANRLISGRIRVVTI